MEFEVIGASNCITFITDCNKMNCEWLKAFFNNYGRDRGQPDFHGTHPSIYTHPLIMLAFPARRTENETSSEKAQTQLSGVREFLKQRPNKMDALKK